MSRLPNLRHDDLSPDGQKVWDGIVGSRGAQLVNEQGGLIGPFNAFLHAPDVGRRLGSLGQVLRFGTSIERRPSEIALITVRPPREADFQSWPPAPIAPQPTLPP